MVHAFYKENVNVKKSDESKLTFKLEKKLAEANSFDNSNSHEAIADVEVTMQLFELLKKKTKIYSQSLKITRFLEMSEETLVKNKLIYISQLHVQFTPNISYKKFNKTSDI